ncbi:putative quinol monooxygenase [Tenacibaculum halocynthiae]|uniref:putative quinol monooxygenase n=1 Tax=Tenacibaculum halocynthiae TaxID=1254437 RepID=UPI0038936292
MEKIIIAQITVKENQIVTFLKLASEMVKTSNQEEGCITYQLLNDVYNKSSFLFYEKYQNEKAVKLHNTSFHFNAFLNDISSLLSKEPIINIY